MDCPICGTKINLFNSKRILDGKICRKCYAKIPSLFIKTSPNRNLYEIEQSIKTCSGNKAIFSATSSYGRMHIDEINGLFAISKRNNEKIDSLDIYSFYDLENIGLTCDRFSSDRHSVFTDIRLTLKLVNPNVDTTVIIKKRAKCTYKRIDNGHVLCTEPKELTFFNSVLTNALTCTLNKIQSALCGKTLYDWEMEKARAIFMLEKSYTKEELNLAKSKLYEVYCNEENIEDYIREKDIIDSSYNLLMIDLEKENK